MRCSDIAAGTLLREGSGKVGAIRVPLARVFGQRPCQHRVQVREIGSALRNPRWWRIEMVADYDSAI
jgi:hypothetical protein